MHVLYRISEAAAFATLFLFLERHTLVTLCHCHSPEPPLSPSFEERRRRGESVIDSTASTVVTSVGIHVESDYGGRFRFSTEKIKPEGKDYHCDMPTPSTGARSPRPNSFGSSADLAASSASA